MRLPLKVAIVGTNDPRNYGGGRYHGLIMAYAIAAGGGECHVVTDHVPSFVADCEPLAPGKVTLHRTPDFVTGLPEGRFDWVVVVPTGIFMPHFYENCLEFAARAQARLALVNFESANWFNGLAPEPRDPRLWDYWRRVVARGGLVLSSTRESDRFARDFYAAEPNHRLRFEVWSPPINSPAARRFDGMAKDGSILAFVRPQDKHKGSTELVGIDPTVLQGRALRLVAGRDLPPEFRAGIEDHLKHAPGSRLEVFTRISDLQKFRLMTTAQAVLFPTRFEGFGYPPVEAAYVGTESVCFDLPVLRETVGKTAHFAPADDMAGFSQALGRALDEPERREALRVSVLAIADFDIASELLADILLRSSEQVSPCVARPFRTPVGPFYREPARSPEDIDVAAPLAPLPSVVRSASLASSGDAVLSATFHTVLVPDRIEASNPGGPDLVVSHTAISAAKGFTRIDVHVVAPGGIVGRRIKIVGLAGATVCGDALDFEVDRLDARPHDLPVRFGMSADAVEGNVQKLRGWILAGRPVTEVRIGDGRQWWSAPVSTDRADVLAKYPTYPTARCQFVITLPTGFVRDKATRLLALSGTELIEAMTGWPPVPASFFPDDVTLGEASKRPVVVPGASPAPPPSTPPSAKPVPRSTRMTTRVAPACESLAVVNRNDTAFLNGIGRTGAGDRLGSALVSARDLGSTVPGMLACGASGVVRQIVAVDKQGDQAVVSLDGPLNPHIDGFPAVLAVVRAGVTEMGEDPSFVLQEWTDNRWWRGVWNHRDARWRTGFFLVATQARQLGIDVGARLRFHGSGLRTVTAAAPIGKDVRIWLDDAIKPVLDGAPYKVRVVAPAPTLRDDDIPILPGEEESAWRTGILDRHEGMARRGTRVRLRRDARVSRGSILAFASGRLGRVVGLEHHDDAMVAILDQVLDPGQDGSPGAVRMIDDVEAFGRMPSPWLYPDAGYRTKDPLHILLARTARAGGSVVLAPSGDLKPERPRVLFVTLVPPAPANQGNRAVTRNFIQHLVDLGFDVDVVLQGWIDALDATRMFGDEVRILSLPFPNWADCDAVRERKRVAEAADALGGRLLDAPVADALRRDAHTYHPYFVVRDEVVEAVRTLATTHRYQSVVVNYTHMLRVTEELSRFVDLPPVCVITHDALSRLPTEFQGQPIDTTYRACTPEVERQVLDAVPGVVMAISASEAAYFRSLGVSNRVVLTEYDAVEETRSHMVPETGFEARTLVFHGSANPMNVAGLNWFLDECWADILDAVKSARLLICGRIGDAWKSTLPNIEIVGEVSREAMFELCRKASIAINPCVAGTGLKIKTVEAASMGLPAVCLPLAVEGLEAVADRFAIVADTGEAFAAGCIALLSEEARWRSLRASALALATERFSRDTVYREIDEAMGWLHGAERRHALRIAEFPRQSGLADGPEPTLEPVKDPIVTLEQNAEDAAALLAVGLQLIRAGQIDAGRGLVESVAVGRHGDPKVAALAARLALDTGEPWLAAVHGAVVIGQRPLEAEGYYLVGTGLLDAGQTAAAVECLTQGLLVASHHEGMLAQLHRALLLQNRLDEAERWRGRRSAVCPIGEYFGLDVFRLGPQAIRGWKTAPDGSLELSQQRAAIRFVLPDSERKALNFTLDLAVERNGSGATEYGVDLLANDRPFRINLSSALPVQTIRGSIPALSFGIDRVLTFSLDFGSDLDLLPKVKPIGIMLTEA